MTTTATTQIPGPTVTRVDGGGGGWCASCEGRVEFSSVAYLSNGGTVRTCSLCCPGVGDTVNYAPIRVSELDAMQANENWLGFGYLGTRHHTDEDTRATMDQIVVRHANFNRWTRTELFLWANSTYGRHAADAMSDGPDVEANYQRACGWDLFVLPID